MKTRFAFLIILFSLLSCQREIASCECNQIDVYGMPLEILVFTFVREESVRQGGKNEEVKDLERIKDIKNFLLDLELLPDDYGGIDVRVVLDLICSNGGKSTVLLGNGIAQIGDQYYDMDNEQFYQLDLKEHEIFKLQ